MLTVDPGAQVSWNWADGTTSSLPAPVKAFGSPAVRVSTLSVTPWSALKRINLGYDGSDGGDLAIEAVPPQQVVAVSGLEYVAPYLQKWCSSYVPIASLNFDNFVNLDTIEAFGETQLTHVSLHNTPKLARACFESCALTSLDLSESPALSDLRGAANKYSNINFGTIGSKAWHICAPDNLFTGNLPVAQFPQLQELLIWNDNQNGPLRIASPSLTRVVAHHNSYTSADFSGAFTAHNSTLEIGDNKLVSLNLAGGAGLISVNASNNLLQSDAVDSVLATLDSLGAYAGILDLTGNSPAGVGGLAHAESLRQRKWTVNLAPQEATPAPLPGSIVFSTENASVDMEVRGGGNTKVTWHWSDGSTDTVLTPSHQFPNAGHRTHYLVVDPPGDLNYFGARNGSLSQGISAVSGLANYANLYVLYLYNESVASLDLAGCASLYELHLAGNPVSGLVADKWFADLDAMGVTKGVMFYPPEAPTTASDAARASLAQKGWTLIPY